ncbi:hypothetical protein [Novipirellula artificiosorum]|uniref:Uncharacterized protein n=1 Tax=Novipirellula artificiosorum TaxID=2528016 RepID=A0A5C6DXT4_9BACT|nr:hypothetical protein [Novipirellula artificiosorum]TWU39639.1 hypothetical protein Poly41_24950 [Novipirellula artificiosorum]
MTSAFTTARLALKAASVATRFAGELAQNVQHATGFDDLLRAPSSEPVSEGKLQTMIENVGNTIRSCLSAAGIDVNPPVEVSVGEDAKLRVSNGHPRAAEIEKLLTEEPRIADQLRQIQAVSSVDRIVVAPANLPHS